MQRQDFFVITESVPENERLIETNDLTKIYSYSSRKALDGVSFKIPSSGICVLIGKNGSGKTTLVRILSTEMKPTKGTAVIDGMDVVDNPRAIRERIAIVPQEARTLNWATPRQTIFSYLLWRGFSRREARERTDEAIDLLNIRTFADSLNRNLSGGMKRKVLVATVLASEADIIFMDEPTTGLDPISRREFWSILEETSKKRFVFLTTHYLEEAESLASEIAILESGMLIGTGTLDELRKRMKYSFSVRIMDTAKYVESYSRNGIAIRDEEGVRIFLSEEDAYELSRSLSKDGIRYTINPLSLEDIFFYMVSGNGAAAQI
ncbi:MAG: ABC transporter ATP-binding protein [Methanomassiliicoccales archaeon]